jgi:transposase
VVATPPETSPVDFGTAVHAEAMRRGLGRAKQVYVVMDGALWLWDLVEDRFARAIKTLDFHHARDHLWALANSLHGQDTPEAKAWAEPLLQSLRKGRENRVVRQLQELLPKQSERAPENQELIEREVKFFEKHRDHLHYQAMEKAGAPRGSGAIESLGKQLQQRLRGCGQIWSRPGFTRLLKVVVLVKNQDEHLLWK